MKHILTWIIMVPLALVVIVFSAVNTLYKNDFRFRILNCVFSHMFHAAIFLRRSSLCIRIRNTAKF